MRFNIFLLISQYIIFHNQHNFISAKAIIGENTRQAHLEEFSFIASIMVIDPPNPQGGGVHACTGALITRKDVLTAAHCLEDEEFDNMQVVVGTIDLRTGERYFVFWWITFDQWAVITDNTNDSDLNDIASIRLLISVPDNINPVQLSSLSNEQLYGEDAVLAGWGLSNEGIIPDIMEVCGLKILSNTECQIRLELAVHNRSMPVDEKIICSADTPYVLMDLGDSGGPLLHQNTLVAINTGVCPFNPPPERQLNIHLGIHHYRIFISSVMNNR